MTGNIRNRAARTLCTLAQGDESILSLPLPDRILGFHAQQAIEKLMKGLIACHDVSYPYTHQLADLIGILTGLGETMPSTPKAITSLTAFAVALRYDFGPPLSESDRNAIVKTVAIVREHILTRILEIQAQTPINPSHP